MKILVTGGKGTVGREMDAAIRAAGHEPVVTSRAEFDVADRAAVLAFVRGARPDAIVHLAAMTNVDLCEQDRTAAVEANLASTEHLATAAGAVGAHLTYVSTGGVFGARGTDGPFHELDTPAPANFYALTKLWGEVAALRAREAAVVRAGFVVGGGREDQKFVGRLLQMMDTRPELRVVDDRLGTLTFAAEFARFLVAVATQRLDGIHHFASPGVVSRYDVVMELVRLRGLDVRVEPVPHTAFPTVAPRGRSEAIVALRSQLGLPAASEWREGLAAYLRSFV